MSDLGGWLVVGIWIAIDVAIVVKIVRERA